MYAISLDIINGGLCVSYYNGIFSINIAII